MRFRPALAAALVPILFAAACTLAGGPSASGNPYPPAGRFDPASGADGLIVGHRLMAAGEYDLALRAYYRAGAQHGVTVDVLSALGSANLKLGRLGQAEQMLRRAIDTDERFVPAWNNLGVVLMETGRVAEASEVFKRAFALDAGRSEEIRQNLRLALAKMGEDDYDATDTSEMRLVRRGQGQYLLLTTP